MSKVKSVGSFSSLKCCFRRPRLSHCWRMLLHPCLQWLDEQLLLTGWVISDRDRMYPTTWTRTVVHPYAARGTLSSSPWRKSSNGFEEWERFALPRPVAIWISCTQLPQPRNKSYICNVTHHFHISDYMWGMKRAISYQSWLTLKFQFLLTWYKICYLLPFFASPWQQPLPPSYITKPLPPKHLHQLITLQNFIT
jgi:hypothetical protein